MSVPLALRRAVTAVVLGATSLTGVALVVSPAQAATCPDVEIIFARGSTEAPGLGITGRPFVQSVQSALRGKTVESQAVDYAADIAQTSAGDGATDMSNKVKAIAARCADTDIVVGGYSQGASVTDIALGIPTSLGRGGTIPQNLQGRVAAVAVFGNPLRLFGQNINTASQVFGARATDICNNGDPVCAGGSNALAHLLYGSNGSTTRAAQFVAQKVNA